MQPVAIATWEFGARAVEVAGGVLREGGGALDAAERGINAVEVDPTVTSVGLGGRPNADGIVELDAAIMDGRTCRAGSVACLQGIARPISVAREVMQQTPHVMLAGSGALEFALSRGFARQELLTPESRRMWQGRSGGGQAGHDTVGLVALDAHGNLAAGCSTSGLPYKLPGRIGDSPIIGAGLYADNETGGASATGIGEEIMKVCASFLVVEFMRHGHTPADACRKVLERIATRTSGSTDPIIGLIALSKSGDFGSAAINTRFPFAVWTPKGVDASEAE